MQLILAVQSRKWMLQISLTWRNSGQVRVDTSGSSGVGAIPQREPRRLNSSGQTIVYQWRVPLISAAGSAKSGVPYIFPPSCLAGHGMGENRDVP